MENGEISFGRVSLDLRRPELRRDGQRVRIHRRALGILCALAEAKGEIVSRDELMALAMAWSPSFAWTSLGAATI